MSDMERKQGDLPVWQRDASGPEEGHGCRATHGREYIFRMQTGADPVLAIEAFAREKGIRYGRVHTAFMGAFEPCHYYKWIPDKKNLERWHCEYVAIDQHLLTLGALGGMIGQRPTPQGGEETFVAMHFVAGGAWDAGNIVGRLAEGTRVKGCVQCFITELLDIEADLPAGERGSAFSLPENFYRNTKNED